MENANHPRPFPLLPAVATAAGLAALALVATRPPSAASAPPSGATGATVEPSTVPAAASSAPSIRERLRRRGGIALAVLGSLAGLAAGACTHVALEVGMKTAGLETILDHTFEHVMPAHGALIVTLAAAFLVGLFVGGLALYLMVREPRRA